jgi:hypothetical protein
MARPAVSMGFSAGAAPLERRAAATRRPPQLRAVPRRRRTVAAALSVMTVVFGVMLGVTVFQTRLAERQLQLDRIERDVNTARDRYDQLRQVRAILRSPERLAAEAAANGLVPAAGSEFVEVDPAVKALVAASAGGVDEQVVRAATSSLEEFRRVKATTGRMP